MKTIRELCSFEQRLTGSDSERRAAKLVADRLRRAGMRVDVEPTYVHPQMPLVQALHCVLGVAGSLVGVASPPAGFAIILFTSASLYLDVDARFYLVRRLFFRRASQNVVARPAGDGWRARLVLTAHLDAGRASRFLAPRRVKRVSWLLPRPVGSIGVIFLALASLLPILGLRLAGIDTTGLSVLQVIPTLVLLVAAYFFANAQIAKVVPAANGNASGVATALALAEELADEPTGQLDVWVVVTGAGEALMEGMRSFLRAHRKELAEGETYFVNLDSVGAGAVRYTASEGLAVGVRVGGRLGELCAAIATADREDGRRFDADALQVALATDALPAALAGFPATTVTCREPGEILPANHHTANDLPDAIDPKALDRTHDFTLELARRLDADVARRRG